MMEQTLIKRSEMSNCRFCGEKDTDIVRQNENLLMGRRFPGGLCYFAECIVCRARGPVAATQEEALAKWVAQKAD